MSLPLLATKWFAPPPGKILVDRPRLATRLDESLHPSCQLALIAAPAGFGKTTLLSAWAKGCGLPVSWLTLDEEDNDPLRFLAYLVAAAEKVEANPGRAVLGALQSPQPPVLAELVTVLTNQLGAISRPFVLVLDDYHLINSPEIHKALAFLIEHHPPHMHLAMATRKDPPLPIPLLRARGQLVELRQADLRFTPEESAAFLKLGTEVTLSGEDMVSLANRTDGWVAGLQMAALSIRGRADASRLIANFSGGHAYIVDYFAAEVLAQQPESLRTFLLQTSILKQLCGSLCDAVTGRTDGQQTLERLQQANLFVVDLDSERCWFRYHHLFRDLLDKQLHHEMRDIIPELHRRASRWYEQSQLVDGAIDHAVGAEDFDRAASLIGQALPVRFWRQGESTTIRRWLEALPDASVCSRPELCAYHALALFLAGQRDKAEARLRAAESALETVGASPESTLAADGLRADQSGMLAAVRAYIAYFQGDGQASIAFARRALDLLPKANTLWRNSVAINLGDGYSVSGDLAAAQQAYSEALDASRSAGNLFLVLLSGTKLAAAHKIQGHLRSTEAVCQQLVGLVSTSEQPQTAMAGRVYALWGDILCEWNDLERAETLLRKAVELCLHEGNVAALGLSYAYLMRVLLARQNPDAMEENLHKLEALAQASSMPVWISKSIVAWKAWVLTNQGRLEEAKQLLHESGITADHDPGFRGEGEWLSLARLLIAQGRPAEADKLMERLYAGAETQGQLGLMIACLCLRAVAQEAPALRKRALTLLEKALVLAEPEGYIQIFLEEGPPMARLLYEVAAHGTARQYAGRLLAAFSARSIPSRARPIQTDTMVEPLSRRELEITRLIADGLSNQQIAARLCLSVRTIKFHTGNIYSKLGVKSRTEAVAQARFLGLLSP